MMAYEGIVGLIIFVCLAGASLCTLALYDKLPARYHHDDTNSVVRLVANIFVVMTSLVLGLMVNSSKGTFEAVDRNVHSIATEMILLDRALRRHGPEADEARQRLSTYVTQALTGSAPAADPLVVGDRVSERLLLDVGTSMNAIKPSDPDHVASWQEARQHYQKVVELRWVLVEQSEGTIPTPLLAMVVAWLILIFASFGYRAPRNIVVVISLILAAGLIASTIYLILDMDTPLDGPIQVSDLPLRRVLAELKS
jgi:hypothetical protein